jgi:pyruvate,orthophosphate dikinase
MVHAKHGEPIILVLDDDEWGEAEIEAAIHSAGIVARSGGLVSHAAVAARGFGIPAVVGVKDLEILANRGMLISGTFVPEGSYIEVNGDDGIVRLLDS